MQWHYQALTNVIFLFQEKKREYGGGCKRPQFGMNLFFKNEKLEREDGEREDGEMSDRRKSGMSCPPLRPRWLGSYCTLPKYNLICALRHLAIHTRACTMTSTAVWPCITCLERQQGSLSFNNMQCIGVLMTHVKGITTPPPGPALRRFISLLVQVMLSKDYWQRCVDSLLILHLCMWL